MGSIKRLASREPSIDVIAVTGKRIDDRDLFDRKVRDDLDAIRMHDQHFLNAYAPPEAMAVLGFERKHHAGLDFDRMVERPDPGNHGLIVLCEPEAMAPEVGCRLVFFRITPGFLRRRPF